MAKYTQRTSTNTVDPKTGTITYEGDLELCKGNHKNMPPRTDAYQPDDERGHVNASSLSGSNNSDNVVPQHRDVNHGEYYQMERGERNALKNGASIHSEKIAYSSNQSGGRPDCFMVNDTITHADGHTSTVNISMSNLSHEEQDQMNAYWESHPEVDGDYPNPGDSLRESMSPAEYAELMESTEADMPGIADSYSSNVYSYTPSCDTEVAEASGADGAEASGPDDD